MVDSCFVVIHGVASRGTHDSLGRIKVPFPHGCFGVHADSRGGQSLGYVLLLVLACMVDFGLEPRSSATQVFGLSTYAHSSSDNCANQTNRRDGDRVPLWTGFCRSLKLTPAQQVAVGLGLSRSPNPAVAKEGVKFLVARVPGLAGAASGGHLSLEALHSLLELVNSREEVSGQVSISGVRSISFR